MFISGSRSGSLLQLEPSRTQLSDPIISTKRRTIRKDIRKSSTISRKRIDGSGPKDPSPSEFTPGVAGKDQGFSSPSRIPKVLGEAVRPLNQSVITSQASTKSQEKVISTEKFTADAYPWATGPSLGKVKPDTVIAESATDGYTWACTKCGAAEFPPYVICANCEGSTQSVMSRHNTSMSTLEESRSCDPLADQLSEGANRGSKVPLVSHGSGSSHSGRSDTESQLIGNAVSDFRNYKIRRQVDITLPVSLSLCDHVEGRTLPPLPTGDGMTNVVIGAKDDESTCSDLKYGSMIAGDRRKTIDILQAQGEVDALMRSDLALEDNQTKPISGTSPLQRRRNTLTLGKQELVRQTLRVCHSPRVETNQDDATTEDRKQPGNLDFYFPCELAAGTTVGLEELVSPYSLIESD